MNTGKDETYATKDLVLAAFLNLKGLKLYKNYNPETKSWTFSDSDRCEELSLELRNGETQVDILAFEASRRNLLAMVYDKKG